MISLSWLKFLLRTATKNLLRSPRRTLVSLLAIAFALCAMIAFESFVLGVRKSFRNNIIHSSFGHYKVFAKGFREKKAEEPYGFQIKSFEKLKERINTSVAPLVFASRRQEFFGLLVHNDVSVGAKGIAIEPIEEEKYLSVCRVAEGKPLSEYSDNGIAIGFDLGKQLGVKAGDTITVLVNTSSGSMNALDLTVASLYKTGVTALDENTFHIPLSLAQKLLRIEGASSVLLAFQVEDELQYDKAIRQLIKNEFPDLEIFNWYDLMKDLFDNSMNWLDSQFHVIRWILVVIATLSISNVFMMSILERTGEFGTLRALGTQRRELIFLIVTESLVQALLGAILGVILGAILIFVVLKNGIYMPPPPNMTENFFVQFIFPKSGLVFSFLLCLLVGGLASVLPAIKISRLNIAEALGRNV